MVRYERWATNGLRVSEFERAEFESEFEKAEFESEFE